METTCQMCGNSECEEGCPRYDIASEYVRDQWNLLGITGTCEQNHHTALKVLAVSPRAKTRREVRRCAAATAMRQNASNANRGDCGKETE